MRTENKYIRNRRFRVKHWKRIRRKTNPYEHTHGAWHYTTEEQVQQHLEWVTQQARALENGHKYGLFHAPQNYRKTFNDRIKAQERTAMTKIRQGDYEAQFPVRKKDADWDYY